MAKEDAPSGSSLRRLVTRFRRAVRHDPIVVGVIAVSVILGNGALLVLSVSLPLLGASFCGASLVYWADRVLGFSPEDAFAHPDRVAWVREHRSWLVAEGVGLAVGLLACLPLLRLETLLGAAVCGVLGLVHVLPLLPGRRRVKDLRRGKRTSIAATWAAGGVVLPWLQAGMPDVSSRVIEPAGGGDIPILLVLLFLARGAIVWANVRVADWADRRGEVVAGMREVRLREAGSEKEASRSGVSIRRSALLAAIAGGCLMGAAGLFGLVPVSLAAVDAVGAGVMSAAVMHLRPRRYPGHLLWLDVAVAWPIATFLWAALM